MSDFDDRLVFRSFTHARTHPWVIGKIGGTRLPWQLGPEQAGVLVGSFVILLKTHALWAHFGGIPDLVIQALIPLALSWCMRHLRMEGRSPTRMLIGVFTLLGEPRAGRVGGRPWREPRPTTLSHSRIFVLATVPEPVRPRR